MPIQTPESLLSFRWVTQMDGRTGRTSLFVATTEWLSALELSVFLPHATPLGDGLRTC